MLVLRIMHQIFHKIVTKSDKKFAIFGPFDKNFVLKFRDYIHSIGVDIVNNLKHFTMLTFILLQFFMHIENYKLIGIAMIVQIESQSN